MSGSKKRLEWLSIGAKFPVPTLIEPVIKRSKELIDMQMMQMYSSKPLFINPEFKPVVADIIDDIMDKKHLFASLGVPEHLLNGNSDVTGESIRVVDVNKPYDWQAALKRIKEYADKGLEAHEPISLGEIMSTDKPTAEEVLAQMITDDVREGKNKCCKCGKTAQHFHQSLMLWACDVHSGVPADTSNRSTLESPTAGLKFKTPIAPQLNRAERRKLQRGRGR